MFSFISFAVRGILQKFLHTISYFASVRFETLSKKIDMEIHINLHRVNTAETLKTPVGTVYTV